MTADRANLANVTPKDAASVTLDSDPREKLAVHDMPVAALKPHPRNPRRIRPERLEQLKRALVADAEMLQARPLIALPDGTVVAGNQRLRAAVELGWETIPVVTVDLDEQRATEWMLRDNRGYGEDDMELAGLLLSELAAAGADVDLTGYASGEIDALLAAARPAPIVDPDEAPPLPKRPHSQPGEAYELGSHWLMCGDSTEQDQVRQLFDHCHPFNLVEAIWTDPPYGVEYVGKTKDALTIEGDTAAGVRALVGGALKAVEPALTPNSARFYIAAPPGPRHRDFLDALDDAGWRLHETLVWVKERLVLGHSDYHYRHEPILYGYAPGAGRPGRGAHTGSRWVGGNDQDTVFEFPSPHASREHPTMKPVGLIEAMLVNSTTRRDVVYDPFAGSGSTLIACETLGRQCFAMELDPGYCDVIRQRYADFTGRPELAP
jgi:DNA modification methylase